MQKILMFFRKITAVLLGPVFFLSTLTAAPEKIQPRDRDSLKLDLAILADVHMEGNNFGRFAMLSKAFKNLNAVKNDADALILLGDNTMNGQTGEFLLFYGMLETVNPIKPYYTIVGNHDVGNSESADFAAYQKRNLEFMQTFVDQDLKTLYYAKVINGYHLIFLAPDAGESAQRTFSDAQMDFLETELNKAKESGLPAFVFNHYPGSRASNSRFTDILESYEKTFLIVGHMHSYTRFTSVSGTNIPEIWVPCFGRMDDKNEKASGRSGWGYQMEVYDDKVSFRGVNYYAGTLLENVTQEYTLTDDGVKAIDPMITPPIFPPVIWA